MGPRWQDTPLEEISGGRVILGRSCSIAIDPKGKRDIPSNLDADLQALSGPPEVVAQAIRAFADEGIDHIQAYMVPSTIESVEWLAKVIEILDQ